MALSTERISRWITEYRWVHTFIGILGNICFVSGSILFLSPPTKTLGTYFFIAASTGMLIGAVGEAIVGYERHRLHL